MRLSEYPFARRIHVGYVALGYPDFDSSPFLRALRALRMGTLKYVWRSDGSSALYDLADDPGELVDLAAKRPELAGALDTELRRTVDTIRSGGVSRGGPAEFSDETRAMFDALGYSLADEDS